MASKETWNITDLINKKAELNKFELCFLFMEYVYR